ncbi:PREDICTED: CHD3-type chromatin-remodeling factor PICKLE-like isoform X1 [Lupinus angustifolius]|uniref:CHD3-type chromatin-remodeling factor PICKLE-like isoform X1 n=1 Tax=Lupinus angustifolius TaxID=3871 RepID=UPI00092F54EB|nr:PREDICTED: CHD3-type chromatin-remodeling factor PICKLE-like isoform X1 [Lupinus angustifolius]
MLVISFSISTFLLLKIDLSVLIRILGFLLRICEFSAEYRACSNMSSLAERLRVRSDRKPIYNIDESDDDADFLPQKHGTTQEKFERIVRSDAKEDSCQACGESGDLVSCETCTYAFHSRCILQPFKRPLSDNWKCPECVSPLNDIDKILEYETCPTVAGESDATKSGPSQKFVKQYLVKWKGLSYLHCRWVPEEEFLKAFKNYPRLKTKINNFHRQMASANTSEEDFVAIRPEWTTVDRILACRGNEEKEYLVKWKELAYDECHWELESDISAFQLEIDRFKRFQSRSRKKSSTKQKSSDNDDAEFKQQKEFQQFEHSPEFLSGGSLHPYQLEGLNFLRFSWSKQTHVILADEMGLGKTIQSIAFLASLLEENISPHLVVAPLSTLRNWEREFATWAPQMNVVMYFGSAQARSVIRQYEFYFPKKQEKIKKTKYGQTVNKSKQDRVKFDVLLTSYEMINLDTASLKSIKWQCMIVDEGHRLKNKDSKLFSSLKQYSTRHRVLLTGTPLQNNLDELFMLMHFLDAGKFGSLEEFQEEFKDINQEEQVLRLHKMLAPHLLRRVKKDVMTELPPKKELILRVELSSKQKEYYKAILTRNYEILTRRGGAQISLINVVMELRKLCCHPYMFEGAQPHLDDTEEAFKQLLESSGKLQLLDKIMTKLKEQGHRVLVYTQFQHMLDLLEDYCSYKNWYYERIDGKVGGAERQIRIDRFNAKNSTRFCFLLSTRAGGIGINLATADTVIIYDSDWNPHADLQAMARAHRLGQTNKVMIFRLITRGTIEERMMQLTKKKMVLEHLVVGKLKAQNINQEELNDIISYGSKELFADENDEAGKSRQIHYDDAAIDRLLDRDQVGQEEANLDNEDENGFLKAFKVANFEYIDEVEAAKEEARKREMENKSSASSSTRANYWEELLGDKYQEHKVDELNALGKGKRSRNKWQGDDFAAPEDVSSDGEDDNYEADPDLSDDSSNSTGTVSARRPHKRKVHANSSEPLPLMEGEGRSLRVLGFNQNHRAAFVQILMRFGVGDYDWKEFTSRMKQKSYEEIRDYGTLFLSHIADDITDSPTFSDGVPKEGLRIPDILVRIAVLLLIREKVKYASENPGTPLFSDDIVARYPGLKCVKTWKEKHDVMLLQAVLKHGYGRWQAIVDDKSLKIQEVICQEMNIPIVKIPVPGQVGAQVQNNTNVINLESSGNQSRENGQGDIAADGANITNADSTYNQSRENGESGIAADGAQGSGGTKNQTQLLQETSMLYQYRDMQRKQIEFVKRRVQLLEKGVNAEYQKEYFSDPNATVTNEEHKSEPMTTNLPSYTSGDTLTKMIDQLPQVESIASEDFSFAAGDYGPNRSELVHNYNKMCKVVNGSTMDIAQAYLARDPTEVNVMKNLHQLETICEDVKRILTPIAENPGNGV